MTPQRLELQEHLKYDALLACVATRSRGRRSDVTKIRLPQQRARK